LSIKRTFLRHGRKRPPAERRERKKKARLSPRR
jgi:hypothetical protein